MVRVDVRIRADAVVNGLQSFANGIPGACTNAHRAIADYGFKQSDSKVPVITGRLRASGGVKSVTAEGATYGWDADYAGYVEFGTPRRPARNFASPTYKTLENGLAASILFQHLQSI